jgi:hypothetical protein
MASSDQRQIARGSGAARERTLPDFLPVFDPQESEGRNSNAYTW